MRLPVTYCAFNMICSVDTAAEAVKDTWLPVVSIGLQSEASSVGVIDLIRDRQLYLFILGADLISYHYLLA